MAETCPYLAEPAAKNVKRTTDVMRQQAENVHRIEKFLVTTILFFAVVFVLSGIKKQYGRAWLKRISSTCYISVPILMSYTFGLMGRPTGEGNEKDEPVFLGMYSIWAVLLLFTCASFDSLSAFSLDEINGRSKILFQFLSQLTLLVTLAYPLYLYLSDFLTYLIIPITLVFLVASLKVVERFVALAHASGTTSGMRGSLRKMTNYINKGPEEEEDPLSMKGYNYLVGPRYSKTKDDEIVDGITLEKIWGCSGRLLSRSDPDGQLKDTCLSFAFFWLLLGKIRMGVDAPRMKAWKLVHDGLLSQQDRAFRVIEVELYFLRDYFYTKNMFFYLNGFFWKLIPLTTFPIMFWYFTRPSYSDGLDAMNELYQVVYDVDPKLNTKVISIMIMVLYSLEVIQFLAFITSKWCMVILLCYYASKREVSSGGVLSWLIEAVIRAICRVSLCTSTLLRKPWKRELDQLSLLESCTSFSIFEVFGNPLPKPSNMQGKSVTLSKEVKTAVVLSLHKNGQRLSNGVSSLNDVEEKEKVSWACKLQNNCEMILVWHIATSICEMKPSSDDKATIEGFEVATKLSKYCAYLIASAPLLVSIPVLEAEVIVESVVKEARGLLKKPFSVGGGGGGGGGGEGKVNKYDKLTEMLAGDKEGQILTTLQKGVQLGGIFNSMTGDERRWKILAEFWAEFILFLAPSNKNEMDHVEMLAEGGEFITQLWALLIHAGIDDRND